MKRMIVAALLAVAPLAANVGEIDLDALKALMRSEATVVLLDARGGRWDDGTRLPGAKQLTYECSAEEAAALIPTKDTIVVAYCGNSQCPAGGYLSQHLSELGYTSVVEYPEGIRGWAAAGNPVVRAQ